MKQQVKQLQNHQLNPFNLVYINTSDETMITAMMIRIVTFNLIYVNTNDETLVAETITVAVFQTNF